MIITILFFIPLFLEGAGIEVFHQNIWLYYLVLPALLFIISLIQSKKIYFPKGTTIAYGGFLFFTFISAYIFSLDKQISIERILFLLSCFLIFVYAYNQKEPIKRVCIGLIILGSVLFSGIAFLFYFHPKYIQLSLTPFHEYQFVISAVGRHNHLGDFLGLLLIILTYYFFRRKVFLVGIILTLPFFLFSFSRSAYIDIFIVSIILLLSSTRLKKPIIKITTIVLLLFPIVLFFIISTHEFQSISNIKNFQKIFIREPKELLNSRSDYFYQATQSFIEKPFFGVGPGNFKYVSAKYITKPSKGTNSAHNIFLDLLSENGLFATIYFLIFLLLIFRSGQKKGVVLFFLWLFLLLNFQTDYTYRIDSFFVLFILLSGLLYRDEIEYEGTGQFGVLGMLLFTIFVFIFTSIIFQKTGFEKEAILFYPWNKTAYQSLILQEQKKGNSRNVMKLSNDFQIIAPNDPQALFFLISIYEQFGDKKKELSLYEFFYQQNPRTDFEIIKKIFFLKKEMNSQQDASQFLRSFLKSHSLLSKEEKKIIITFCKKNEKSACNEIGIK